MHVYGKCSTIYVNIKVKQDITPSYNSVKMNGHHFFSVVHNINWNKLYLDEIQKLFYHVMNFRVLTHKLTAIVYSRCHVKQQCTYYIAVVIGRQVPRTNGRVERDDCLGKVTNQRAGIVCFCTRPLLQIEDDQETGI